MYTHHFQGLYYALGQLKELSHFEMGGNDLEWNVDAERRENQAPRVGLVETIASDSIKCLVLSQSSAIDSDILSDSTRVQHPQRLLQVVVVFDCDSCNTTDLVLSI